LWLGLRFLFLWRRRRSGFGRRPVKAALLWLLIAPTTAPRALAALLTPKTLAMCCTGGERHTEEKNDRGSRHIERIKERIKAWQLRVL
jgi:hypothetical protein